MDDQVIKYLKDISSSIGAIFEYLEATGKVLRLDAGFQLAHAKKIIGLRNLIAHAYDSVQEEILWGIIVNHLPSLKAEVDALLGSSEIRD
jgi:uncharacterized protein with HEPN domain